MNMPKRKHSAKRHIHASPRKTYAFFRSKFFYFLGFAVIVAIAAYQSGFVRVGSVNILGDTSTTELQHEQEQVTAQSRETEVRTATGVIKTKVENSGAFKIEGATPGYQFKLETQNGQSELQVENAKGEELHDVDRNELEEDLEDEGIEISTEDGKIAISKDHVTAVSTLPISVDTTRRQILVTTPNGKTVSLLLPNVAIQHLTSFGILMGSSPSAESSATPSAFTLSANPNGIPVYTVPGYKEEHLFGFIPVKVPVSAVVSAETGAVMEENHNFFGQLLDAVSF